MLTIDKTAIGRFLKKAAKALAIGAIVFALFYFFDIYLVIGILLTPIYLLILFLLWCYLFMAKKHLFFAFAKENCVMYIMTANGKKWTGKFIFSSSTQYIDKEYNIKDLPKDTDLEPEDKNENYVKFHIFGMYWVGIPPFKKIYEYHQIWQEWKSVERVVKNADGTESKVTNRELILRDEPTPYLFTKTMEYGLFLPDAENAQGFPLNLWTVFFLRATNIRTPIFKNDKPLGQIQSLILAQEGLFVKGHTFTDILSGKREMKDVKEEHDSFSEFILELNTQIPGGKEGENLNSRFAFWLEGANVINAEISGSAKDEINAAIAKVAIAEQDKLAKITESEGIATSMNNITKAKEERYKIFKNDENATEIEKAEKMFGEHSKLTTYVTGSGVTPTIPIKENK